MPLLNAELEKTARALVAEGKGILAADESSGTIKKRFDGIRVDSTEESRRAYRDLLFTTPGVSEFISGVIFYDETIRQKSSQGTAFPEVLHRAGIIPGIKVDEGAKAFAGHPGEKMTEGLDGLRERLSGYRELGARFAKWRAVITIGQGIPTESCLRSNAEALARYAALCQEASIVPIVEPEVLMDGGHTLERCYDVTERTLRLVFEALYQHGVGLEGILLKPNMVISGQDCASKASVEQVADATVRCFRRNVPAAVPGIVFLSGGQSDALATEHLNAMNAKYRGKLPWELSFSYGRALQTGALQAWRGATANVSAGQKAFYHRSKLNSLARYGRYTPDMERT